MDALDPYEDLTELGHHLADLPVEPRYGKMILHSVVLKCLDPILTIACALAYKDPCECWSCLFLVGSVEKNSGTELRRYLHFHLI